MERWNAPPRRNKDGSQIAVCTWEENFMPQSCRRRNRISSSLLCAALFGFACAQGGVSSAKAAGEVTVPYVLGLTGGTAAFGAAAKTGIEIATKVINDQGGIKSLGGAKLQVEIVDHQSKQDIA